MKKHKKYLLLSVVFYVVGAVFFLDLAYKKNNECPLSKFRANTNLHSQFYEDYILSYVFNDIDKGYYVDVGSNDPIKENATYYFYKKGWHGIVIEPIQEIYQRIALARPRDVVLNIAASDKNGREKFFIVDESNGWSSLEQSITKVIRDHNKSHRSILVEVKTLTSLLSEYDIPYDGIDFIKIDVEGHEYKVLKGLDLNKYRPKVIALESASPTNAYGFVEFEDYLIKNNYIFGMTDDLNYYYYRKESPALKSKFDKINYCVKQDKLDRNVECRSKYKCSF